MLTRFPRLAGAFGLLCFISTWAVAQTPDDPAPSSAPPVAEKSPAQEEFEEIFKQWKETLKEIRSVQVEYQVAEPAQRDPLQERFKSLLAQAKDLVPKLKEKAEKAYAAAPNDNKNVADFLMSVFQTELNNDNYEEALRVGKLLIDNQASIPKLEVYAGVAAFNVNQFDLAEEYFQAGRNEIKAPGPNASPFEQRMMKSAAVAYSSLGHYRKLWATEGAIRKGEAEDDDLPRVKLETSKGDIVVELFENEAPNTVANFIDLVEKGFYNGLTFHRVIRGFMAQGGCPKGDGTGGPGYAIRCECDQPNARKHFRGSLSMAHAGPDTGGSQFFLTFVPTPHLDGKHTAFGRVVEGIDVLSKLQAEPNAQKPADKIEKATVLRKREHEYKPHTLPVRQ